VSLPGRSHCRPGIPLLRAQQGQVGLNSVRPNIIKCTLSCLLGFAALSPTYIPQPTCIPQPNLRPSAQPASPWLACRVFP